jgi:hypothetical protein
MSQEPGVLLKGVHGDLVLEDGHIFEIEDSERQRIYFRIGFVFYDNVAEEASNVPGVWVTYIEGEKAQSHTILWSPEVMERLVGWYQRQRRSRMRAWRFTRWIRSWLWWFVDIRLPWRKVPMPPESRTTAYCSEGENG